MAITLGTEWKRRRERIRGGASGKGIWMEVATDTFPTVKPTLGVRHPSRGDGHNKESENDTWQRENETIQRVGRTEIGIWEVSVFR